jgi:hypothetical protein
MGFRELTGSGATRRSAAVKGRRGIDATVLSLALPLPLVVTKATQRRRGQTTAAAATAYDSVEAQLTGRNHCQSATRQSYATASALDDDELFLLGSSLPRCSATPESTKHQSVATARAASHMWTGPKETEFTAAVSTRMLSLSAGPS